MESDFLGGCDPPGKVHAHQEAGDVIAEVGKGVYLCRVGVVFKASEVGVLFAGKGGQCGCEVEAYAEAVDGGWHVVQGVGFVAFVEVLHPFVEDAVRDVARDL